MTAAGVHDWGIYALDAFRVVLETGHMTHDTQTNDALAKTGGDASLENLLPALSSWLGQDGEYLANLTLKETTNAGEETSNFESHMARLGPLAEQAKIEKPGFSPSRWRFWRSRLEELSKSSQSGSGAIEADVALDGFEKMKRWDEKVRNFLQVLWRLG